MQIAELKVACEKLISTPRESNNRFYLAIQKVIVGANIHAQLNGVVQADILQKLGDYLKMNKAAHYLAATSWSVTWNTPKGTLLQDHILEAVEHSKAKSKKH